MFLNYIMIYPNSAFFYTTILFLTTFLAGLANYANPKFKKLLLIIIIFILSLSAGLRGASVGTDTRAYMMIIETCRPGYFGGPDSYVEKGFVVLIKGILFIYDNPQFVMIIISLIINSLIIARFWSLRDKISFSFVMFSYGALYYQATFSGIRQWIAVAIIFYASKYAFENKYGIFTVFVLIASLIHNSALVALIYIPMNMLFINKKQIKHRKLFYTFILFSPFMLYGLFILLNKTGIIYKYNHLLSDNFKSVNIGISLLIKISIILFVVIFIKGKDYNFTDKSFYKKVILVFLVSVLINFTGYFYKNIFRISWYYALYECVFYSMVIKNKRYSTLLKYVITIVLLYLFFKGLNGSDVNQMPYTLFYT